ncbi:LuxR C-terminal-related transcriptional regulator [Streptomyces sp. NPDC085946]|uniref:LuxR C-terminal-related transcriptional regulator n=1 Tax=Streptomyces sp. NPDC085946 TaxID=3365744 RepID=UPI0037D143BD
MTGQTTPRPVPLRYRARRQAVAGLLDRLRTDGGVRVVTGEPGCGRTAFLESAARSFTAGPVTALRADPARSGQPYGGLRALLRATGAPDAVPGAAPAGEALLAALDARGAREPVLVCVDDAHLWDAASRAALGHAAARLHAAPRPGLGLLLGVAGHRPVDPEFAGLPVLRLGPLSPADAAALVDDATDGAVVPDVRDELVAEAEGSPALLLALVRRLSPAQLGGRRPLPRPLADAEVLTAAAGGCLTGLPPEQHDLLLTLAAAVRASGEPDADAELVRAAVAEGRAGGGPGNCGVPRRPGPYFVVPGEAAGLGRGAGGGGAGGGEGPWRPDPQVAVLAGAEAPGGGLLGGGGAVRRPDPQVAVPGEAGEPDGEGPWCPDPQVAVPGEAGEPDGRGPRRPDPHPVVLAGAEGPGGGLGGGAAVRCPDPQVAVQAAAGGPDGQGPWRPDPHPVVLAEAGPAGGGAGVPAAGPLPEVLLAADGRLRFRSALLGRAVYAAASPERRHAAHQALSRALSGGPRLLALLHRSWASAAPGAAVADALAEAAADPAADLPHALRCTAHTRAAELTPDGARRAHRYTAAAAQALLAGDASEALRLLDAARSRPAPAAVRGRAELLRGTALLADGPVDDARESFLLAARLLAPRHPEEAATASLAAADAAWAAGDMAACLRALEPEGAEGLPGSPESQRSAASQEAAASQESPEFQRSPESQRSAESRRSPESQEPVGAVGSGEPPPEAEGPPHALLCDHREGMRAVLRGRFDLAAVPLRRVVDRGRPADDPDQLLRSAAAALLLGDVTAARRAGARALAAARTLGSAALEPRALEYLAYAELRAGRHALARTHAEEGLRSAYRTGQRNSAAHHHAVLALAASIEADTDLVTGHVTAALQTARRHGLAQAATLAQWAAARADLGRGRPREAADRLGPLVRPGPRRGHFAVWMLAVPCYVEAAALSGQPDSARPVVEDFAVWAACDADPQAPAQLLRCRALLAPPDAADALFREALDRHEEAAGDFERARTELLYGKWLRRRRRLREARARLGAALLDFELCGAGRWAQQAGAELRANGAAPSTTAAGEACRAGAGPLSRLTPQQLRIVRCVAEGATNREVALSLSVSTRTVDYHLRNVFAVLGVRSRVELARMVEQAEKTGALL